ncbi:hypothetical protein PCE1_001090 [Barthelona sp. PCE]
MILTPQSFPSGEKKFFSFAEVIQKREHSEDYSVILAQRSFDGKMCTVYDGEHTILEYDISISGNEIVRGRQSIISKVSDDLKLLLVISSGYCLFQEGEELQIRDMFGAIILRKPLVYLGFISGLHIVARDTFGGVCFIECYPEVPQFRFRPSSPFRYYDALTTVTPVPINGGSEMLIYDGSKCIIVSAIGCIDLSDSFNISGFPILKTAQVYLFEDDEIRIIDIETETHVVLRKDAPVSVIKGVIGSPGKLFFIENMLYYVQHSFGRVLFVEKDE